jgi:Na+/H+ antiporter NhaD/arsenite permease-like protein
MPRCNFRNARRAVQKNRLLLVAFGALVVLEIFTRKPLHRFPAYVDWNTIVTLTGLLLITTAIKESGFFTWLACRISKRVQNERQLALFLIFTAAVLSMFLTNDIALFIMVPLTLSLQEISGGDYVKIIVFEAIAVNAGSALTAVGNPQNIYLWHQWGISFPIFTKEMLPFGLILGLWLYLGARWVFPPWPIRPVNQQTLHVNRFLFWMSAGLFVVFILSVELDVDAYFLVFLFLIYFLTQKKVFVQADWGLIVLFIIIFLDVHLLYRLPIVNHFMQSLPLQNPKVLFVTGALLSQVISNVPATILLVNYSSHFKWIAYAVNVGGNGVLIASFANLIALRFVQNRRKYAYFHRYSLLYLLVTGVTVYLLLV